MLIGLARITSEPHLAQVSARALQYKPLYDDIILDKLDTIIYNSSSDKTRQAQTLLDYPNLDNSRKSFLGA